MSRALLIAVLVLGGSLACGTSRQGDTMPGPEPAAESGAGIAAQPEDATLLRRVAEAVDGYRDNQPRFVVARRQFPHKVEGVFPEYVAASQRFDSLGGAEAGLAVFGPFRAREDPPEVVDEDGGVDSVVVYVRSGAPKRFRGESVDALFWSLPAFDKFIAPYLTSVYGPRHAAEQRERYRTKDTLSLAKSSVIPHYRSSF